MTKPDPLPALQERFAHLERLCDELSLEVARQQQQIDRLTRRVSLLMEREAEREAGQGEGVMLADKPPPHW